MEVFDLPVFFLVAGLSDPDSYREWNCKVAELLDPDSYRERNCGPILLRNGGVGDSKWIK